TSLGLLHRASREVVSSGVPTLDKMLGAGGFYRASTILLSGAAGTGKSNIAGHFVAEAGRRGERSLYVAFEESQSEIVRNMTSMIVRLIDFLKMNRITVLMTSLIDDGKARATSRVNISSLVDMWLMLDNLLQNGVRTRTLSVVKARGMGNSNQTHEILISKKG